MAKLILVRHLQSEWNKENKFTGWTDIPLSEEGRASAPVIAEKIKNEKIDAVFTSPLIRNKETTDLILKNLSLSNLPIQIDQALNERKYGILQGLNKDEMKAKYGAEQVQLWRRSWDEAPPEGESLEDVFNRVIPFYRTDIEPELKLDKNVLVVASHNSLRALAKYIENISDQDISNYEIPSGGIIVYDLDQELKMRTKEVR